MFEVMDDIRRSILLISRKIKRFEKKYGKKSKKIMNNENNIKKNIEKIPMKEKK
jgi:hypothetical protein